jgi:hypothetical protein
MVVLLFFGLVILFSIQSVRTRFPLLLRKIRGANQLRHMIGLTVEEGSRMHVSLGSGNLINLSNSSALVGLSTLDRVEQLTSTSDLPPMCTSGDGCFQILSQDVARQNTVESNAAELKDSSLAQLAGVTPFSYAVGTMDALNDSGTHANILIGDFGVEAGLLCEAAVKNNAHTLAGSNSMIAQSVFFALAEDTLIGEEVYALPAYLGVQPAHQASLRAQDILRLLLILLLVGGAILCLMGWI